MHLPLENAFFNGLTQSQRFCVEIWHIRTHSQSLDGHKVKIHNGRTILNELRHEYRVGHANGYEFKAIIGEAIREVKRDQALDRSLRPAASARLIERLSECIGDKAIEKGLPWQLESARKLRYFLDDTAEAIEKRYLEEAFQVLEDEIRTATYPFTALEAALDCFLADLVSRGWALESLHEWAGVLGGNPNNPRTFEDRFQFVKKNITSGEQQFKICLRLTGSPTLAQLGTFKKWVFSSSGLPITNPTKEVAKYLRPLAQTSFAAYTVMAVDFKSACHSAIESFESCIDRLRYNFHDSKIFVDPRMLVVRSGDSRTRIEKLSFMVPNPLFVSNLSGFQRDSAAIDALLENEGLDETSRDKIQAAARHYRMGRDSESYRDKLLSWWFGLEFLTKISAAGSIGETVNKQGTACMSYRYVPLLLLDIEPAIRKTAGWPPSVTALLGCSPKRQITPKMLLQACQDPTCRADIAASIAARPSLAVRFSEISEVVCDAGKLLKMIESHQLEIGWQLQRIYRIRCSLVHGTPISLRLVLLCSSLEFYLRETIIVVLKSLSKTPHIGSLGAFYERLGYGLLARKDSLKKLNSAPPSPETVFDGVVQKV